MNAIDVWLAIGALTLSTILSRCTFAMFGNAIKLPVKLQHALSYAPAAIVAGIIAPELFVMNGEVAISLFNPKLLAGMAAVGVFLMTRNMLMTVVAGMAVFTVLRLVL